MNNLEVYIAKNINLEERLFSRSGGIFTLLAQNILRQGGVVYGCIFDDNLVAKHVRATSILEIRKMSGSKYVQSNLGDCFRSTQKDLLDKKLVLFSGTSCQIAGLKKYLRKDYPNLVCVDIICYGVPSPIVLNKYIQWVSNKHSKKICSIDFRNKKDFGWHSHIETIYFDDQSKINSNVYAKLFCNHSILRPSCYKCHYKSVSHPGDITLGDAWGINKYNINLDDNKGISLVLINSSIGLEAFKEISNYLEYESVDLNCFMQESLIKPYPRPNDREEFWESFNSKSFNYIARKYGDYGAVNKIKHKLRLLYNKIIK